MRPPTPAETLASLPLHTRVTTNHGDPREAGTAGVALGSAAANYPQLNDDGAEPVYTAEASASHPTMGRHRNVGISDEIHPRASSHHSSVGPIHRSAGKPTARDDGEGPEVGRSLGKMRKDGDDDGVVLCIPAVNGPCRRVSGEGPGEGARGVHRARLLPKCKEIDRMDECIARHGDLMLPLATIHTHEGSAEHAARTCCCAFEREVTLRRMRAARDAVVAFSETMFRWQSRLASHLRQRCLRRAGAAAFRAWIQRVLGSRRQRRMLVKGAATWVRAKMRRHLVAWRSTARDGRAKRVALRRTVNRMHRRRERAAMDGWREAVTRRRRLTRLARGVVSRLHHRRLSSAWNAWSDALNANRRRRHVMAVVAGRMRNRATAASFAGWRDGIAERRRLRRLCARVAGAIARNDLRRAMNSWRGAVEAERETEKAAGEQRRAARSLRAERYHRDAAQALERERAAFLARAEETERRRVKVFHEQLEAQQRLASQKAEAAMEQLVQGARQTAAKLAAEAAELRENKPAGVKGSGLGLRQKRTQRAAQHRELLRAKHEALATEVTARVAELRSAFAEACETAERRLRAGGPGSAVAALSDAERVSALVDEGGVLPVRTIAKGEASLTSAAATAPATSGSRKAKKTKGRGSPGGKDALPREKEKDASPREKEATRRATLPLPLPSSSRTSPSTPSASPSPPIRVPASVDAALARAASVSTSAAKSMTRAAAMSAAAKNAAIEAAQRARARDWETRVEIADAAARRAAAIAREASAAAAASKRDFRSLQMRRRCDEAEAMRALDVGKIAGDGTLTYGYSVGDEGPDAVTLFTPSSSSALPLSPPMLDSPDSPGADGGGSSTEAAATTFWGLGGFTPEGFRGRGAAGGGDNEGDAQTDR